MQIYAERENIFKNTNTMSTQILPTEARRPLLQNFPVWILLSFSLLRRRSLRPPLHLSANARARRSRLVNAVWPVCGHRSSTMRRATTSTDALSSAAVARTVVTTSAPNTNGPLKRTPSPFSSLTTVLVASSSATDSSTDAR